MKVLVIPDCHLKPWMFAQADTIMKKGIADKAVCLMDLADDFGYMMMRSIWRPMKPQSRLPMNIQILSGATGTMT